MGGEQLVFVGSTDRRRPRAGAHRAERLIFCPRYAYLRWVGSLRRPTSCGWECAILAEVMARAGEVFVGRARELGELERAVDATRAGSGITVLVAGEAGIGKTRLASELAKRARDAGFEVLLGRSIDLVGTELPYQPFDEALRPLGEPAGGREEARLSATRVREHARAARRPGSRGTSAARARGSALGRCIDDRSDRLPRSQPRRPAGAAARDLPRRRASSAERMRRLANEFDAPARRSFSNSAARAQRANSATRGSR